MGESMKRTVAVAAAAALAMGLATQTVQAAGKCAANGAAEAEQAIRYMTELMVASSACKNSVYAEFALRNRTAIIAYQKTMITHMHGTQAFDHWDTVLANSAAQRQAALPAAQFCQQAAPMMQQAAALDANGFRAYAAAQAAMGQSTTCKR